MGFLRVNKLSTRVARFLGHQFDERKQIAERMAEFYDKRSAVVHGENVEKQFNPDVIVG
jgi:hypothetical protein